MPGTHHRILAVSVALTVLWTVLPAVALSADATAGGEHARPALGEDLSLWGFVAFVVFFATCLKLLGPWAAQSLAERERTENAFIAEAEQKNRLAQELLAERRGRMEAISEEIDERIAEARRDADHTRKDITAVGHREAEVLRNRARAEISRSRAQALNDLFATMAGRVVELAEVKVKERLAPDEHERLIDDALRQFVRS